MELGRNVTPDARSIAMIWLTQVPAADGDTNHVRTHLDMTAPTCHQESVPLPSQTLGTFNVYTTYAIFLLK